MGMTLYMHITPIAQMSRKRCYLRAKVVADCCLVSVNVATGVILFNIRLLPYSRSDNITLFCYNFIQPKLNASFNKPNKARVPSLNPKQSEISPLIREVVYKFT